MAEGTDTLTVSGKKRRKCDEKVSRRSLQGQRSIQNRASGPVCPNSHVDGVLSRGVHFECWIEPLPTLSCLAVTGEAARWNKVDRQYLDNRKVLRFQHKIFWVQVWYILRRTACVKEDFEGCLASFQKGHVIMLYASV
jgi:hypothetical protein